MADRFDRGTAPAAKASCVAESFTSISNGTSQFGHVSWIKLQPSLVYDIAPQWSMQIGGFLTVAGINAGRELGPTAGVWYRFSRIVLEPAFFRRHSTGNSALAGNRAPHFVRSFYSASPAV
jgi:hypothetical protein